MGIKRNLCMSVLLVGALFLFNKGLVYAVTKVPASEMLKAAKAKMGKIDPQAWIVKAKYSQGDRKLRFRSAEFTFDSPELKQKGSRKQCLRVYVKGGEVTRILEVTSYWEESPPDAEPEKAFEGVMKSGFRQWWQKNEKAWLYMRLSPKSGKYEKLCSGRGPFMWKITGSGPGVNEDYTVYLDASTMSVCEERKKSHDMNSKQMQESLKKTREILKGIKK